MSKVIDYATKGKAFLAKYPALSAALVSFGVFLAGYFGLNVSGDTLVAFVGVLNAVFGLAVHSRVVPLAKLEPPAGSKPVIPAGPQPEAPLPVTAPESAPEAPKAPEPAPAPEAPVAPPAAPPATPPSVPPVDPPGTPPATA